MDNIDLIVIGALVILLILIVREIWKEKLRNASYQEYCERKRKKSDGD